MADKSQKIALHTAALLVPIASARCNEAHCTERVHIAYVTLVLAGAPRHRGFAVEVILAEPSKLASPLPLPTAQMALPVEQSAADVASTLLRLICDEIESLHRPNTNQIRAIADLVIKSHDAHVKALA